MPKEKVLRIATPLVVIERARYWMAATAYAEVHGEDQPLAPLFTSSGLNVVLPSSKDEDLSSGPFLATRRSGFDGAPVFLERLNGAVLSQPAQGQYLTILISTRALPHARIRWLPGTVSELLTCFAELEVDLAGTLISAFRALSKASEFLTMAKSPCIVIIRTPIERSVSVTDLVVAKAFLTDQPAQSLAEAIGAPIFDGNFVGPPLTQVAPNIDALRGIELTAIDVYGRFNRRMALAASGIAEGGELPRKITLMGAGAVGSHIALTAARMGLGSWNVVDPDHLMPHNLARYALGWSCVGRAKAEAVASEIDFLLGPDASSAVVGDIRSREGLKVLEGAELVIDASASVPVSRWLGAVSEHSGRTVSVFLNPSGTDLVILREGTGRVSRLDHVEMSYHWKLAMPCPTSSGECRRESLARPGGLEPPTYGLEGSCSIQLS
jgi:hypothetical protein